MNLEAYIEPHNLAAIPSGLVFIAFFLLVWGGALHLVAFASGWKRLYLALGCHSSPQVIGESSQVFRWQTSRFNKAQYKNCLNVKTSRYALTLSMFLPFRFGHKPLVIPWTKIESITPEKIFFYRFVRLKLIENLNTEITLPEKIFLNNSHVPSQLALTLSTQPNDNPYQ